MCGKDKHLGYLDVGRGIGSIDGNIGNVVARERLDALIDIGGPVVVTVETGVAEVRLDKSRLQVRHADGGMGHINA